MQGDGEWRLWSVCNSSSLLFLPPHAVLLLQHGGPPMGDSPSKTAPARVLTTGHSPSGTGCSSVGPPRGHKHCQQSGSSMGSSLHGSTGPGRNLLQHGFPTGSQLPSGIHRPAPAWGPPWNAGGDLLHHGPPWATGARPASPWSSSWAADSVLET